MKLIGELDYELAGERYKLKPTFAALSEIEDIAGRKCPEILSSLSKQTFSIRDAVACIYCGLKASNGGKEILTKEEVFQRVASDGLFKHFKSGLLVSSVLTGKPLTDFKIVESTDGSAPVIIDVAEDDKKK